MAKPTELAPISATFQTGVPSVDNEIAELRARIAELEAALAEWQKKAAAAAVVLHEKIHECNDLKADCARLREDAERNHTLLKHEFARAERLAGAIRLLHDVVRGEKFVDDSASEIADVINAAMHDCPMTPPVAGAAIDAARREKT